VVTADHTLPLQVLVAPAHVTDCTLGPTSLDRLLKMFTAHQLPVTVRAAVDDAGLEAQGLYTFLEATQIAPVIALHPRRSEAPRPTGTATHVNDAGVPLCPAGLPMRRHSSDADRHRISYHGPVKRPTHRQGQLQGIAEVQACPRQVLCQPDTPMGPVVDVRTADDPRLYPPIPRDSAAFKALMARRTGGERSNSLKKGTYRLGERPCRSTTHFRVRLALVRLLEHAQVWLAEDRARLGDDPQTLLRAVAA
jgi:hypothetical protein